MLTHIQIAQYLVNLYNGPAGFDFYEGGGGDSGICYAIIKGKDGDTVFFRGSTNLLDWARDLFAMPAVFPHQTFGPVHAGFSIGMDRAAFQISTKIDLKKPLTICGHSLGAARARVFTAMFLENYQHDPSMLETVVFGEPLSGMQQMSDYLAKVPSTSYRNGGSIFHDNVTDVPFRIKPTMNWVRASKLTLVSAIGPDTTLIEEALDPFTFHHMPLYLAGVRSLFS